MRLVLMSENATKQRASVEIWSCAFVLASLIKEILVNNN